MTKVIQVHNKKLNIVKTNFIKSSIIHLIITTFVLIILLSSLFFKNNYFSKSEKLKNDIEAIKNNIAETNKKQIEATEALSLWKKVNESYKKREGLAIDKSKLILDNLSKAYYLSKNLEINLSTPIELSDIYKTDTTVIMSSEVNIRLGALTDEYVLKFFDSIKKNFPGFINFKQFSITRRIDLSPDIINQISVKNFPEIVDAQLIFEWRDFKDIVKLNYKDSKQ
ncbi:MAG: hypothetical protein ACK4OM_05210 [Alphaproteobacteria bacterium]